MASFYYDKDYLSPRDSTCPIVITRCELSLSYEVCIKELLSTGSDDILWLPHDNKYQTAVICFFKIKFNSLIIF